MRDKNPISTARPNCLSYELQAKLSIPNCFESAICRGADRDYFALFQSAASLFTFLQPK